VRRSGDNIVDMLSRLVPARSTGDGITIGLFGRGIQSSRSPVMHEREGARLGMRYSYVLVDFDRLGLADTELGDAIKSAEQLGFAGLNITHPFKQSVVQHLNRLAPDADTIGAVNTVVFDSDERTGHNTDAWGFAQSFRDTMAGCPLDKVVQFGAGGAGAAVAHALMELGAGDLAIVDSDRPRAAALAKRMASSFGSRIRPSSSVEADIAEADGIVNATPVGMEKYPGVPFATEVVTPRHWVGEVIYFPEETELLRRARSLGCRTLAGTGMAVYQAVRAFELFTGIAPDRAAMTSHFEAAA